MNKRELAFAVIAFLNMMASPGNTARAAQTGDEMSVKFRGTFVVSSPCVINNDEIIDVSFGSVGVDKVNGSNYQQNIPYSVDCKGAADSSAVNITMKGQVQTFDEAALVTSVDGLGIKIIANGEPMKINKPLATTLSELESLVLVAVPIKDVSKNLAEQNFTAVATLTADYQ